MKCITKRFWLSMTGQESTLHVAARPELSKLVSMIGVVMAIAVMIVAIKPFATVLEMRYGGST